MFKDRPLDIPEHRQQEFICKGMQFGFFGKIRCVLSLHAPQYGFWFMIMTLGVIPSDDAIQDIISFMVVPPLKTGADVLAVALMLCQMFWHPPCEHKNVMH
jgi:hypothetical protein